MKIMWFGPVELWCELSVCATFILDVRIWTALLAQHKSVLDSYNSSDWFALTQKKRWMKNLAQNYKGRKNEKKRNGRKKTEWKFSLCCNLEATKQPSNSIWGKLKKKFRYFVPTKRNGDELFHSNAVMTTLLLLLSACLERSSLDCDSRSSVRKLTK